jgi:hypothetical protein
VQSALSSATKHRHSNKQRTVATTNQLHHNTTTTDHNQRVTATKARPKHSSRFPLVGLLFIHEHLRSQTFIQIFALLLHPSLYRPSPLPSQTFIPLFALFCILPFIIQVNSSPKNLSYSIPLFSSLSFSPMNT